MKVNSVNTLTGLEIAVIGMAGRFPGADTIGQYWENLKNGVESVSFLSDKELQDAGISPETINNPAYVRSKGGVLANKEYFDASFFRYTPVEAELLSPESRLFHECAWAAMEDAGYAAENYKGLIGLYAGASASFLWEALVELSGMGNEVGKFSASLLSSKGFLCAQTAYKMDLRGPASFIQTACSTSLVAVNTACRALLTGECQMALAGGVFLQVITEGYMHQEGMVSSRDGHVRTFDHHASGAVSGDGVGIVMLKLLRKAIKDGDHIHAIIKGSYTNNDGDEKVGFTAPGIRGQANVIMSALKMAGVSAESIGYVEAHGTATALGDVTEITALNLAFNTGKRHYCGIGSVKTNIGHLGEAAGIAGLIKTILAITHKQLPPSLNFSQPNPAIDFGNSPFYVNKELKEWPAGDYPRRAGVSSFGIGGTNAHIILEEAMVQEPSDIGRKYQLLLLSAKTENALESATANLLQYLKENRGTSLADIAYTLQKGRKHFKYRQFVLCENIEEAIGKIEKKYDSRLPAGKVSGDKCTTVFMFPGLGSQYPGMCKELYEHEKLFRQNLDHCFDAISTITGLDLHAVLYPSKTVRTDPEIYSQTDIGQFLIFVIEYSLTKMLMGWGINPDCMIGYSFGEYVAACIAGVFSIEDAIRIVQRRGEIISAMSPGRMLSIPWDRQHVAALLNDSISLAIDNGASCIVSGPEAAILSLEGYMKEQKVICVLLESTRGVHSHMMQPAADLFLEYMKTVPLNPPCIPYLSNVTGDFIRPDDAMNPAYWARQMRDTVEFSSGIQRLLTNKTTLYIEIGPGSDISAIVNRMLMEKDMPGKAINIIRPAVSHISDSKYLLFKLGQLWLSGIPMEWGNYYEGERRFRVPLPTYPFERLRYWKMVDDYKAGKYQLKMGSDVNRMDWMYIPGWKRGFATDKKRYDSPLSSLILVFLDELAIGEALMAALDNTNTEWITVRPGSRFRKLSQSSFELDPTSDKDYYLLFGDLKNNNRVPKRILHLFSLSEPGEGALTRENIDNAQQKGYYSLLNIAQALAALDLNTDIRMDVMSNGVLEVTGDEKILPQKVTILGPVKVIPQEYSTIRCGYLDVILPHGGLPDQDFINRIVNEWRKTTDDNAILALRGDFTWVPVYENRHIPPPDKGISRLKHKGVYLITGGLGGIALHLSDFISKRVDARLVLIGRSPFPPREEWESWLNVNNSEDPIAIKINRLLEIEKRGSEIITINADISDRIALQKSIETVRGKFGTIDGLIHTATVADGAMIAVRKKKLSEAIFASKLHGTILLDELLHEDKPDFVIYFSALTAILGGFGQVGYCAANTFLDAYAAYAAKKNGTYIVSIDWGRWKDTGIARIAEKMHKELTSEDMNGGLQVAEAIACFESILEYKEVTQVAVAEFDLTSAVRQSKKVQEINADHAAGSGNGTDNMPVRKLPRPDLSNEYIGPENDLEEKLCSLWQDYFGIERIGVMDNFFEVGGDSLKGMILLKRIKRDLDFDAGIKIFFAKPTIRQIAGEIMEIRSLIQRKERRSKITV